MDILQDEKIRKFYNRPFLNIAFATLIDKRKIDVTF